MVNDSHRAGRGGVEDASAGIVPEGKATLKDLPPAGRYSLVQTVFNWGANIDRIILRDEADAGSDYTVSVVRRRVGGQILDEGDRKVVAVMRSDATGATDPNGDSTMLLLEARPGLALAQPYYTDPESFMGELKAWADCRYTVRNERTGEIWNRVDRVFRPDEEGFSTGVFHGGGHALPFAWYAPKASGPRPLILWLHGAGSGGTDPGFLTGGMRVTGFLSDEAQSIFGSAHVLMPQCPTWWLDDGGPRHRTEDGRSVYADSVMALLADYCSRHPDVDRGRVYIGGCSNGGYLTLRLAIDHPEWFAAAFPVCAAFEERWMTEAEARVLAEMPLWLIHCAADPVVDARTTSLPVYERLRGAGARDLHLSLYDAIVDPECGYTYMGHFAWVYALANLCTTDFGERRVTLYEWCAAHRKG